MESVSHFPWYSKSRALTILWYSELSHCVCSAGLFVFSIDSQKKTKDQILHQVPAPPLLPIFIVHEILRIRYSPYFYHGF